MGTKLNFNIEDAGLSVDGSEKFNSSGAAQNITIAADKITSGTVASARLPYTIRTNAPVSTESTASGHIWFIYSS